MVIRTNGNVIFSGEGAREGCWWGEVARAMAGRRVAVPACELKGAVAALDIGGSEVLKEILLFDSPFRGVSHRLEVKGRSIKNAAELSLSPDGSKLAVLSFASSNNPFIELFELPAPIPEN